MFPYASWLVWALPIFSSLLIPLIARFSKNLRAYLAVAVSLIAMLLAFSMIPDVYFNTLENSDSSLP